MAQDNVLRLINGSSTELVGWRGVSVLFASPGVDHWNSCAKVNHRKFVLPTWSLHELRTHNQLLAQPLPDDELVARYDMFGGVPRSVFARDDADLAYHKRKLEAAIGAFDALQIIQFVQTKAAVRATHYSHCVLQMVPDRRDFRASYHLDFLSPSIAERFIDQVKEEDLMEVSKFAIGGY